MVLLLQVLQVLLSLWHHKVIHINNFHCQDSEQYNSSKHGPIPSCQLERCCEHQQLQHQSPTVICAHHWFQHGSSSKQQSRNYGMLCIYSGAVHQSEALWLSAYFWCHSWSFYQVFRFVLTVQKSHCHLHSLDLLESAIACFNSSWEEDSEAGLDRCVLASWYYFSMWKLIHT